MPRAALGEARHDVRVDLDRVQAARAREQRGGDGAAARADLDDAVARAGDRWRGRCARSSRDRAGSAARSASSRGSPARPAGRCARPCASAASRLPGSARPVPARSSAVPWSTEVRTIGRPSVTLTASPKAARFSTGRPWSWYMASTASQLRELRRQERRVGRHGAHAGRARRGAAARARARSPRSPRGRGGRLRRRADSGRTRGCGAGGSRTGAAGRRRGCAAPSASVSAVIAAGTSASGRCVVASATRRPPPASIITGRAAPQRAARYSVWPVNGMPASLMTPLCTGAVTIASNSPARQPSTARSSRSST